ncbi:hypothetical protein GCM10010916_44520 [Paenibacillus abyssi]|uniref:Uncharacterized protein n=2 Tax=Paenibacillus abyssi TaxID=1340531 RepID=A0A917LH45_9BACL|nr:hypothetical protein GCM10010916_44520 [Paenibacillus abyssi]
MNVLKKMIANTCPDCNQALLCDHDAISYTKACPQGHYKEETYPILGVKIVFDAIK